MKFDDTYLLLFGFKIFEPMVLLTNSILFVFSVIYFIRLNRMPRAYPKQMGWFMLLLGISSMFGAAGHAVHLQLGETVFAVILFLMNAFSLLAIYFCFRGSYTYAMLGGEPSRVYIYLVMAWVAILLAVSAIQGNFLLIKIHAGIVLLYALIAHYLVYRRNHEKGSGTVVLGILISFLPIIVHSLKLSLDEWFNYKDISHVIMIISLVVIYKGVHESSSRLLQVREVKA